MNIYPPISELNNVCMQNGNFELIELLHKYVTKLFIVCILKWKEG